MMLRRVKSSATRENVGDRHVVDMPADVAITKTEITVRFHRRAHLPIVLASGLIDKPVAVPWWNGRALRLVQ